MFVEQDSKLNKCLVWNGPKKIELINKRMPKVESGSLLLKVRACAICGSDLRIYNHGNPRIQAPRVIGHEISGDVIEVGEGVREFKVGDRVAIGADVPCGSCEHCINDRANCCDINYAIGYQFDGGFAEYLLLPKLVVDFGPIKKFSVDLDYAEAALAEPLACCINGYERALVRSKSNVVIFGAGPIGIMLALLAPIYDCKKVIVIDPNVQRLQQAKDIIPDLHIINPNYDDVPTSVMSLTNEKGAEIIFTACSDSVTHEQAIHLVAKRGVVNLFGGLPKSASNISISSNLLHYREAYLTGSHGSTPKQHAKALQLIETGKVRVDKLITHKYQINAIEEAFLMAMSGNALKVVVTDYV